MIQLLPGARQSSDTDSSGILRVNGMPSNSQQINIEGQNASNGFNKGSNQIIQAGVESIQEVAVQTSNYSAEYGQAGGGYFNYTMKSGANQLLFVLFRVAHGWTTASAARDRQRTGVLRPALSGLAMRWG